MQKRLVKKVAADNIGTIRKGIGKEFPAADKIILHAVFVLPKIRKGALHAVHIKIALRPHGDLLFAFYGRIHCPVGRAVAVKIMRKQILMHIRHHIDPLFFTALYKGMQNLRQIGAVNAPVLLQRCPSDAKAHDIHAVLFQIFDHFLF